MGDTILEQIDELGKWERTCSCNSLTEQDNGSEVVLMGWVNSRRDHGSLIFIDLRDREGITQVVFQPEENKQCHQKARQLRTEFVISIKGKVRVRPGGMKNVNRATGGIEVVAEEMKILNTSKTTPFLIEDEIDTSEDLRLRYRYLDLRRPVMQKNFFLRHRVSQKIRQFLSSKGFLEIETPVLTKSTPEGARDYLVPSRISPGSFYALPQSPQLFKQILMIGGFDRYFQIVKCFRDEDLRMDRQPEFTQIDMEMSFVDCERVMKIVEEMVKGIFSAEKNISFTTDFPILTYEESIERFGLDAPDMRFGMELVDVSDIAAESEFRVFAQVVENGGKVKAIKANPGAPMSRKQIDDLTEVVKIYGAKGLAWMKIDQGGISSPIKKFFSPVQLENLVGRMGATGEDTGGNEIIFFIADKPKVVAESLGRLRVYIASQLGIIPDNAYKFVWITEFPLFEYDTEQGRFVAMHHPFTAPMDDDISLLESEPGKVRAKAYDLVLNGQEIGGGSIRIHRADTQRRMFKSLGITEKEADDKFGFLIEALEYGAPPHGGIALGFDRLMAILAGISAIRDVIAFPKTTKASCLMTGAPCEISPGQLKELGLKRT
ncbi:MAG: aspartate--tRNA ligase [bacterium]